MFLKSLFVSICLLAASSVSAHARLKPGSGTPPRNDSTGLKTAECGGETVPRGTSPKVYKPGEEITVEWEETINHPGYFVIRFSEADDKNFDRHVLVEKFVDTQNTAIDSPTAYHKYSTKVKLPNVVCESCTLQLIQVMEENPAAPTCYYSCSDIKLAGTKSATGATTTPAVSPLACPAPPPPAAPVPAGQTPVKPTGVKVEKVK